MTSMRSRLDVPARAQMTDQQRAVHNRIVQTRGNDHGPFLAWLLSPKLADAAQELGAVCRYGTSLSLQESELLIMHVASWYDCPAEAEIHGPIAKRAGLSEGVLTAIRNKQLPPVDNPRLLMLSEVALDLLSTRHLAKSTYERAAVCLGQPALVEAVAILGYYALTAYTLNAFEMRVHPMLAVPNPRVFGTPDRERD